MSPTREQERAREALWTFYGDDYEQRMEGRYLILTASNGDVWRIDENGERIKRQDGLLLDLLELEERNNNPDLYEPVEGFPDFDWDEYHDSLLPERPTGPLTDFEADDRLDLHELRRRAVEDAEWLEQAEGGYRY